MSASEAVRGAAAEGASVEGPVASRDFLAWPPFEPCSSLACHWVTKRGGLHAAAAGVAGVAAAGVAVAVAVAVAAGEGSFFAGAVAAVGVVAVIGGCSRL